MDDVRFSDTQIDGALCWSTILLALLCSKREIWDTENLGKVYLLIMYNKVVITNSVYHPVTYTNGNVLKNT